MSGPVPVRLSGVCRSVMPAFRKAMSRPPDAPTAAAQLSGSPTSRRWNSPFTSSATCVPLASSMSATITRAPSALSRTAVARPIPDAPPVISATLPSNAPIRTSRARFCSQSTPRDGSKATRLVSALESLHCGIIESPSGTGPTRGPARRSGTALLVTQSRSGTTPARRMLRRVPRLLCTRPGPGRDSCAGSSPTSPTSRALTSM